jgi:uroporphyrinogen decarboxylase
VIEVDMASIIPDSPTEVRRLFEEKFGKPENDLMTPRERVAAAIEKQLPDRVPFDFWAVEETIGELKNYFDAQDEEELLRLLGIDCRLVSPDYIGPEPEKLPDGSYYTQWGDHRRLVKNNFSTYDEYASFPLADARSAAEVESWSKWPKTGYWDWLSVLPKIDKINQKVPYHIRYEVGGIFESAWALYGLDRFLVDLMQNPEVPVAILNCYTDLMIANVHNLLDAAGDKIDMLYTFDDIAIQNDLLMSPRLWRKYILPCHQRLNQVIKSYGVKIMYHSCGSIIKLVGPLIDEMGIDVLNPLQPRAAGMDMQTIKDVYGKKVAFHGAIDLQQTLPHGSPQDVFDEVRSRCNVLGKGGGYICTSAHYLQADIPLENILTMYLTPRNVD